MKCIKCDCNQDDWEDITEECVVVIKTTSSDYKFSYLILKDEEHTDIGSFGFDGKFTNYDNNKDKEFFVKIIKPHAGLSGYFKVYKKK